MQLLDTDRSVTRHSIFVGVFTALLCASGIFYFDQTIAQMFSGSSFEELRTFSAAITDIGSGAFYFALSLMIYIFSVWILPRVSWPKVPRERIDKIRFASGFCFSALFFVGLLNLALKISFGRARPHLSQNFESLEFDPFSFHWHWHSFPSGHAQVLFVLATLMSIAWPRFKVFFLTVASALALTRVMTHQHFLSDIVLGAAVGYLGTLALFIYHKKRSKAAL